MSVRHGAPVPVRASGHRVFPSLTLPIGQADTASLPCLTSAPANSVAKPEAKPEAKVEPTTKLDDSDVAWVKSAEWVLHGLMPSIDLLSSNEFIKSLHHRSLLVEGMSVCKINERRVEYVQAAFHTQSRPEYLREMSPAVQVAASLKSDIDALALMPVAADIPSGSHMLKLGSVRQAIHESRISLSKMIPADDTLDDAMQKADAYLFSPIADYMPPELKDFVDCVDEIFACNLIDLPRVTLEAWARHFEIMQNTLHNKASKDTIKQFLKCAELKECGTRMKNEDRHAPLAATQTCRDYWKFLKQHSFSPRAHSVLGDAQCKSLLLEFEQWWMLGLHKPLECMEWLGKLASTDAVQDSWWGGSVCNFTTLQSLLGSFTTRTCEEMLKVTSTSGHTSREQPETFKDEYGEAAKRSAEQVRSAFVNLAKQIPDIIKASDTSSASTVSACAGAHTGVGIDAGVQRSTTVPIGAPQTAEEIQAQARAKAQAIRDTAEARCQATIKHGRAEAQAIIDKSEATIQAMRERADAEAKAKSDAAEERRREVELNVQQKLDLQRQQERQEKEAKIAKARTDAEVKQIEADAFARALAVRTNAQVMAKQQLRADRQEEREASVAERRAAREDVIKKADELFDATQTWTDALTASTAYTFALCKSLKDADDPLDSGTLPPIQLPSDDAIQAALDACTVAFTAGNFVYGAGIVDNMRTAIDAVRTATKAISNEFDVGDLHEAVMLEYSINELIRMVTDLRARVHSNVAKRVTQDSRQITLLDALGSGRSLRSRVHYDRSEDAHLITTTCFVAAMAFFCRNDEGATDFAQLGVAWALHFVMFAALVNGSPMRRFVEDLNYPILTPGPQLFDSFRSLPTDLMLFLMSFDPDAEGASYDPYFGATALLQWARCAMGSAAASGSSFPSASYLYGYAHAAITLPGASGTAFVGIATALVSAASLTVAYQQAALNPTMVHTLLASSAARIGEAVDEGLFGAGRLMLRVRNAVSTYSRFRLLLLLAFLNVCTRSGLLDGTAHALQIRTPQEMMAGVPVVGHMSALAGGLYDLAWGFYNYTVTTLSSRTQPPELDALETAVLNATDSELNEIASGVAKTIATEVFDDDEAFTRGASDGIFVLFSSMQKNDYTPKWCVHSVCFTAVQLLPLVQLPDVPAQTRTARQRLYAVVRNRLEQMRSIWNLLVLMLLPAALASLGSDTNAPVLRARQPAAKSPSRRSARSPVRTRQQ